LAISDTEDDAVPFLSTAIFPLIRTERIIGSQRGERMHEAIMGVVVEESAEIMAKKMCTFCTSM
jgi:hypothetical protein